MSSTNRNIAIDLCKGFAILLMIVGHLLPTHNYLRVWIYSFHMPLFFFLAGMTFKPKAFSTMFIESARRLLIPFAICMFGATCAYLLLGNNELALAHGVGMLYPDGFRQTIFDYYHDKANAGVLWFLFALFWGRLYLNGIYKISAKIYFPLSIFLTISCGYIGKYCMNLPLCLLISGCAVGYMALGKWYSENRKIVNNIPKWLWLGFIPVWLLSAYRFYFEMYGFNYLKRAYIICVIVACVACLLIYLCSQQVVNKVSPKWYRWLEWCGRNTLTILICHFLSQEVMLILKSSFNCSFTSWEATALLLFGTFAILFLWCVMKRCIKLVKPKFVKLYHNSCRYEFSPINNGWTKYENNPIIGNEITGTVFDPYVFKDETLLRMVYSDRKHGSLVSVSSKDGILWADEQTILFGVANSWEHIVNRGYLLKKSDKWLLWYTGQNNGRSCIGCAESVDGRNFTRISTQPVLQADMSFEGISVMNPCVKWNEKRKLYQMWYAAGEDFEPDVICYAESNDGRSWNKHNNPVLTPYKKHKWERFKVGGCDIYEEDGLYTMYYIGYQNVDVARICYATSEDGINWKRPERNLLLSPSKESWDADACYKPTVVCEDNTMMLWYNGRNSSTEYIGLATKRLT